MAHDLRVRSKSNSANEYSIPVTGGIEPESGIGGRDRITDNGTACEGRVVSGIDSWTYWGAKGDIEATDPEDLQLSIEQGPWKPASAFGATAFDNATPVYQDPPNGVLSSAGEYRDFFELPIPNTEERRVGVAPGQYDPPALQRTLLNARPEYSIQLLGTQDPYRTDISRANHNLTLLCKDEHFWVEGMLWGRTQFSGCADPYCRNMAFTDRHGNGESAIGGKSATGRYINCDIGHKNDPDEYAAYYYGGGEAYFDRDNTFRATGPAYIGVNNTVTLYIGGDQNWASGDKEVVEGSGIYPSDLHDGMNIIDAGQRIA